MAGRFYISPLTQDAFGRWKPSLLLSPEWAAEADGEVNIVQGAIVDGQPLVPWALLVVGAIDHAALGALSGVFLLPDLTLDARLSTLSGAARTNLLNRLTQLGVDVSQITNASALRDVLAQIAIARLGSAGFNADKFTVR